jgi:lysophospholipase L1-like esterase
LVLPDCEIYLQTVMSRAEKFAARIRELNTAYAVLALRRGITLLDLFPLFDDGTRKIRAQVTYDDLHLNGAGYQVWRKILEPYLANCHRGSAD